MSEATRLMIFVAPARPNRRIASIRRSGAFPVPLRFFSAALAVLALVCASPSNVRAQDAAQVTGAAGFLWGTPYARLVAERGAALLERREAEGVMAMTYDDQLLGHNVVAMYFVHPERGLMRGGYMAPVQSAGDCAMVMRAWDNVVSRRYPDLRFEERTVGEVGGDACAAGLAGRGGYMKVWRDPANGARIMLAVLPGADGPMLTYTTPEADAWERRKNDARF